MNREAIRLTFQKAPIPFRGALALNLNRADAIRLISRHRHKVCGKAMASDRSNNTVLPEKFNMVIDEQQISTWRLPTVAVQLTCPPCLRVGRECEESWLYRCSSNLQVAIPREDDDLGVRCKGRGSHAKKVAEVTVVESRVICSGMLDRVCGANPDLERSRQVVGERQGVSGWTTLANKLHRTTISNRDLRRELIAMIGGEKTKAQADLFQVVGALGNRCFDRAVIERGREK